MNKEDSILKKIFINIDECDFPAIYQRVDQLMIYWRYRVKFGDKGDEFNFFPDATGKILNYKETTFKVEGHIFADELRFYEIIRLLGNPIPKLIDKLKLEGWPQIKQS